MTGINNRELVLDTNFSPGAATAVPSAWRILSLRRITLTVLQLRSVMVDIHDDMINHCFGARMLRQGHVRYKPIT